MIESAVPEFPDYEDEKQLKFEESTIALILVQLGLTKKQVKGLRQELETEFGCPWFNNEGYIPNQVCTHRELSYNFADLMFLPKRSPLLEFWNSLASSRAASASTLAEPMLLVFKLASHGRMIITDLEFEQRLPYLYIPSHGVRCVGFDKFFTTIYGTPLDQHERI